MKTKFTLFLLSVSIFAMVFVYLKVNGNKELNIPVGLISSNWGGTRVEAWTGTGDLEVCPAARPVLERWQEMCAAYDPDEAQERYEQALKTWEEASAQAIV